MCGDPLDETRQTTLKDCGWRSQFCTEVARRRDSEHAPLDIDDHQRARHRATIGENVAA
jgi:hypothetical protein